MKTLAKTIFVFILYITLACLILTPIRMGAGVNAAIPLVGEAERISEEYCSATLGKAMKAYAIAKIADRIISTIQRTDISVSPFGIGMTVAPGEILSAINDAIERISAAYFIVISMMLVAKLLIGITPFVSFKILLPTSIALGLLYLHTRNRFIWAKNLSLIIGKSALLIWLIFPATALSSSYIENSYLESVYQKSISGANESQSKLPTVESDERAAPKGNALQKSDGNTSWFAKKWNDIKETFSDTSTPENDVESGFMDKASRALHYADAIANDLMNALATFIITTLIVPIFILFLFLSIFRTKVFTA
ncbi:hypothetical protein [Nitratidesulfovibrio sp. 1201_IL3209]|uniref:hypothetical protein n=1 Tax=Nitratidesulfovibrio sp. 1201_IL3209 TaxID=3084053 RepID=UPI002FDAE10D